MAIDIKKKVTTTLGIAPIKKDDGTGYHFNGLCPIKLVDVTLEEQKFEKGEFSGNTAKMLAFHFENIVVFAGEPVRRYTHYEKIVTCLDKNGSERATEDVQKFIDEMWKRCKHIMDNCGGHKNWRNIENIPAKDVTKYFECPAKGDATARLNAFNSFFTYLYNFINGDDKLAPIYKKDEGKYVEMWAKMLPNVDSDPKRNRKYYVFPSFVNQGFLAPLTWNGKIPVNTRAIEVKASESLELSGKAKAGIAPRPDAPDAGQDIDPEILKQLQ